MDKQLIVHKSILIKASPEKVWDTIVNPKKVKQYFFGMNISSNWKVGSTIIFEGEYEGNTIRDKGIIREIKKNEYLYYDYWSAFSSLEEKEGNYSEVRYALSAKKDAVLLKVYQVGFPGQQAFHHAESAWSQVLAKMKEISEQ